MSVQQMADRVAELMESRLGIGGQGLARKLERGGRRLPRRIRAEARLLAQAAGQPQLPKLQGMVDHARVAAAYDACVRHLAPLGRGDRRRALLLGIAARVALALLVTAGLVISVLVWRGFV